MKFDVYLPDDLKIVSDRVNLLWRGEAGLVESVGFRATVDGELESKTWPVGGNIAKARALFEEQVFPHLREVYKEELETQIQQVAAVQVEVEKASKRAARRSKKAEGEE